MNWDKRATTRRPENKPERKAGINIVYVGLTAQAERDGHGRGAHIQVGDTFRLLPGSAITLGRSKLCEITVESELLSDAHAIIVFVPGQGVSMMLVDLKTERGTWVAGTSSTVNLVAPGTEFELAQIYRFRIQPAS